MADDGAVRTLVDRANRDLDEWNDFLEHTQAVWRGFQLWVAAGNTIEARNSQTGKQFNEADLTSLSQFYLTEYLAPVVLQRFIAIAEMYIFDLLRILLRRNPAKVGGKTITVGEVIAKGSIPALLEEAIVEKLNEIRYGKPTDWFEFLDSVERLGCPTDDEIQQLAEMKATRDVVEHNAGVVNKTYLAKAGGKARFDEGKYAEVSDQYLRDCWALLKKICNDMGGATIKILALSGR